MILALGFAGLVGYASISDYKPAPTTLVFSNKNARIIPESKIYTLIAWNIGYGGLGRDMDFFYDGGKQVRPQKKIVKKNISAIETFISRQTGIDFFLLQEVDKKSRRSYYFDEVAKIAGLFPGFHSSFGKNYDVFFVPVPPASPLGAVLSGLQTLSRFEPVLVIRHSFPGNYAWPQGLFMLDRCFLVSRYRLDKKRELLVINTHNSAYDDGTLRSNQMAYLKNFLIREYEKGNYVIVGGDWNQCPPGFNPEFRQNLMDKKNRMDIKKDYLPDWQWAYDQKIPSNRRLAAPYDEKTTLTTLIDFFLVSPNIEIKKIQGIYLNFEHSDHNPVKLEVKLKD
ncbi:MAG: endonuclease/exonuclease/phosphatase family protein [Deltaproteobacteria bacterium]|nr:endonuclease/exonuclease/phosphatase family protein [Deltaproteobacteria bacterium]